MESEYQILSYLQDNELTSQRKISKRTGLSLGAVNILIKKMARKGLIKVEKLNPRAIRYILTPKGIKEKTKLTYQFVRKSYNQIINISTAVENLLMRKLTAGKSDQIVLYGPDDEVKEILKDTLHNMNLTSMNIQPNCDIFRPEPNQLVITWRCEDVERLAGAENQVVNILSLI